MTEQTLKQFSHEFPLAKLSPGENTLQVFAKAGGSTGYSDPVKVTYLTSDKKKVRLHILAIGIDKYQIGPKVGGFPNLNYAASGAKKVSSAFARYGGSLYSEVLQPKLLLDADATQKNILDAIDQFNRGMAKDDVGVIFFAGHGMRDPGNNRHYLAAHDTDSTRLARTGVSATQVSELLASRDKGRVYLFLDACYSGAVIENMVRELRPRDVSIMIATACSGDEEANEDGEFEGFFTYALVEGLSGKAKSNDGLVYPYALMPYVLGEVKDHGQEEGQQEASDPVL